MFRIISHSHKQQKWDMASPGNCSPRVSLPHPLNLLNVSLNHRALWSRQCLGMIRPQQSSCYTPCSRCRDTLKHTSDLTGFYSPVCGDLKLFAWVGAYWQAKKKKILEHLFTPELRKGSDLNLQPTLGFTSVHTCRHHCYPWMIQSICVGISRQNQSSFIVLLTSIMLKGKGHKSCR